MLIVYHQVCVQRGEVCPPLEFKNTKCLYVRRKSVHNNFIEKVSPLPWKFLETPLNICTSILHNEAGVTMTLFCTHGRVSGPSSLLDLEVMAPRGYSVPCQF